MKHDYQLSGFQHDPRQRGSALNELVICLLPYLLVILAAVVFWHLLLGKQEAIKYATSNAMPGDATINNDLFFGNLDGTPEKNSVVTYDFSSGTAESTFNSVAKVEEADEPVLPYDSDGEDLQRAIELSGQQVVYNADTQTYSLRRSANSTGYRLENLGFLSSTDTDATYTSSSSITVEVLDQDLIAEVAQALGEWITYHGASANYSYTAPFGQEAMVFEEDDPSGEAWRSSEGMSVYGTAPSAYWPVVEDPDMRAWIDVTGMSSALNEVFSVQPSSITSCGFDTSSSTQYDKGQNVSE